VAVYFSKHGSFASKEYQHLVPKAWQEPGQGPGRFWGFWGLRPKVAEVAVSGTVGRQAGRVLRGYSRSEKVTREARRPRTPGGRPKPKYPEVIGLAGAYLVESRAAEPVQFGQSQVEVKVKYRKVRAPAVRCRNGRGWVSVNHGPNFAVELGFYLHWRREQDHRDLERAELERCGQWNTPLARARRLPPSPRREQLIRRLEAGNESAGRGHPIESNGHGLCVARRQVERPMCWVCGEPLAAALAEYGRHIGPDGRTCLDDWSG
jgi:hypothetical protein